VALNWATWSFDQVLWKALAGALSSPMCLDRSWGAPALLERATWSIGRCGWCANPFREKGESKARWVSSLKAGALLLFRRLKRAGAEPDGLSGESVLSSSEALMGRFRLTANRSGHKWHHCQRCGWRLFALQPSVWPSWLVEATSSRLKGSGPAGMDVPTAELRGHAGHMS